jgi:hypothetical protein
MDAKRLHHGLAAQLNLKAEQILEGAVGEIDFPVTVKQQQPFEHGIEENLLLRLGVNRRLLMPPLESFHVGVKGHLLSQKFLSPPEMDGDCRDEGENEKDEPRHSTKR